MLFTERVFVGINTTGGSKPFVYAALDAHGALLAQGADEMDALLAFLLNQQQAIVAVNAPSSVNLGLVKARMQADLTGDVRLRGVDLRLAEYILRQHGIQVGKTASRPDLCPAWMRLGFTFYQKLKEHGFAAFPAPESPRQWLETHPHATYTTLLGRQPLSRASLEGRLQRQLVLYEQGLRLRDPMDFFEEVTRFRILQGELPFEMIYPAEMLDALAAASVAWIAGTQPGRLSAVGDAAEGQIYLPVAALQPNYA